MNMGFEEFLDAIALILGFVLLVGFICHLFE